MGKVMMNGSLVRAVIAVVLMADGVSALMAPPALRADMAASGFPLWAITLIGGCTLIGGVLYAVPRSIMIGAVLIAGFLGGAMCANARLGEFAGPPQFGALALSEQASG